MDAAKAAHTDVRERARVGGETFFRFAAENREVFKILFGHSAQFDELLREVHQLFIADIEERLRRGVAAGVFRVSAGARRPGDRRHALARRLLVARRRGHLDRGNHTMTHRMLTQGTTVQGEPP